METTSDTQANAQDTRDEMLRLSARGYGQFRHTLVQVPGAKGAERGSTLGHMVKGKKHRALTLYMLLLTCWPWLEDRKEPLAAATWIRALSSPSGLTWTPSTLSRAWGDLEEAGLLEPRVRTGRLVRVSPRREDAQSSYEAPKGRRDDAHRYFVLPDHFWKGGDFARLTLPGLAMLLIILKETGGKKPEMYMPLEKAPEWYGISPRSAQNGLADLAKNDLLVRRIELRKAALSPTGRTTRHYLSLSGPYGALARDALRAHARKERSNRLAAATAEAP